MKFKLLILSVFSSIAIANAQYTVTDHDGNVLQDGDVKEYGTFGHGSPASFDFFVTNDNPTNEIYTRIEFVSAVNATGEFFELCYALQCYTGLTVGQTLPPAPEVFPIAVGETTGEGNHFLNLDGGNGIDIMEFVFAFHQYEADGVTEIGTPLTFTYKYNPTLGVNENSKLNLTVQSTVVTNEVVVNVEEPVSVVAYDLQGRVVKKAKLEVGRQTINVSDLNSQTYILQFNNERGATQTTKIIVQ